MRRPLGLQAGGTGDCEWEIVTNVEVVPPTVNEPLTTAVVLLTTPVCLSGVSPVVLVLEPTAPYVLRA